MAKFDPILGPLRGAIGAIVFSRNKGGAYAKLKGSPTNPNTARQQAARGILAELSTDWMSLSTAKQAAWNGYAETHPLMDPLGNEYTMTGHQAFVRVNFRLKDSGNTELTDPPAGPSPDQVTGLAVTFTDGDTASVAFTNTLGADECLMVWACPAQAGAGDPNFAQARLVGYTALAATTPASMELPNAVADGYTVNFWACLLNTNGLVSVVQKDRETYTAA